MRNDKTDDTKAESKVNKFRSSSGKRFDLKLRKWEAAKAVIFGGKNTAGISKVKIAQGWQKCNQKICLAPVCIQVITEIHAYKRRDTLLQIKGLYVVIQVVNEEKVKWKTENNICT